MTVHLCDYCGAKTEDSPWPLLTVTVAVGGSSTDPVIGGEACDECFSKIGDAIGKLVKPSCRISVRADKVSVR